jgi:hypothetical protein
MRPDRCGSGNEPRPRFGSELRCLIPGKARPVWKLGMRDRPTGPGHRLGTTRYRQEPVPVQHRNILSSESLRMPAQQVVVISAHLARTIVMAYVVEISLRQRSVHQAEDQKANPRPAHLPISGQPPQSHAIRSIRPLPTALQYSIIIPQSHPVKLKDFHSFAVIPHARSV